MQPRQSIRKAMVEVMRRAFSANSTLLSSCNELKHLVFAEVLPEAAKSMMNCFEEIYEELVQEPEIYRLIGKHCCAHCKHSVNDGKPDVCVLLKPPTSFKLRSHPTIGATATEAEDV